MPFVQSFLAVLNVVELLQAVKAGVVGASVLRSAIDKHFGLFIAAYGEARVRLKHHYILHLPGMLRRFGTLIATFTHERKHRLIIRYSRDRHCFKQFELGALEEVTVHQLWEICEPYMKCGFVNAHPPRARTLPLLQELFPGKEFAVSAECRTGTGTVKLNDMALVVQDGIARIGEVVLFVAIDGDPCAMLSKWAVDNLDRDGKWADLRVASDDATYMVPVEGVLCSLTHRPSDDNRHTTVYLPLEHRGLLSLE